jgi:mono/diheme cytochrome c family protein
MGARRLSRRWQLAGVIALATAGLALAGCEGAPPDDADVESGKQLFVTSCGACHALEDAGTAGRIGPNLDDAFRGSRQQGFEESDFQGVVRQWIRQPQPPMEADIVTGADADDVSAYVASVAGLSPDSEVRQEQPFVIRPPVPGGTPVDAAPPELLPGEKIAGPQPPGEGEESSDAEGGGEDEGEGG